MVCVINIGSIIFSDLTIAWINIIYFTYGMNMIPVKHTEFVKIINLVTLFNPTKFLWKTNLLQATV